MHHTPWALQKRNLLILVALLGAWGLILVLRSPWGTISGPQAPSRAAAPTRPPAPQGGGLTRLKKELLLLPPLAYSSEVQSIFGTPPPPPRPAGASGTPLPVAPPPPDPFQEEAKRLRYVGFLQAGDAAMAFIVQGSEVHTLEVGETLGGRFRVEAVTEDAVLLSSTSGDKQVRLPLAPDAKPSAAPKR